MNTFSVKETKVELDELREQFGGLLPYQTKTTNAFCGDDLPDTLMRSAMLIGQAYKAADDMQDKYDWSSVGVEPEDNIDDVISDDLDDLACWLKCAISTLVEYQKEAETVCTALKTLDGILESLTKYQKEHGLTVSV